MTKKNERPRSSVPNKPRESAIYRKIESFITMLIKRTANLPNIPMIQECTKRLTNELLECCAAVSYAYSTPYYDVRYNYLSEMEIHICLIKTTLKILFEYASQTNTRFMTPDQHAEYLMKLDDIENQRDRWMESTRKYMTGEKVMSTKNGIPENEFSQTKGSDKIEDDFSIPENTHFMALGSDRVITDIPSKDKTIVVENGGQ